MTKRSYADLREHLVRLDAAGHLRRIDQPVCKHTQMHPLVRWQFRGGIPEADRKAFVFTNVVDAKGRGFDGWSVAVGAIAANPEIYRIGMNVPALNDIGPAWERAQSNPIAPRVVANGPVHEVIVSGEALKGPGRELEALPARRPQSPWYGYDMGDWTEAWDANAAQAVRGEWMARSERYRQRRAKDVEPNSPVRGQEET
jgi:hypothetical protein